MFSSIVSFIFGSSTTESTNCKPVKDSELQKFQNCNLTNDKQRKERLEKDSKTSETKGECQRGIRNSNKRNNRKNNGNKHVLSTINPVNSGPAPILDIIASASSDGDFDLDDDWFLVEKEGFSGASSGHTALHLSSLSNLRNTPSESGVDFSNKPRLLAESGVAQPLHTATDIKDLGHNLNSESSDSNGSGVKLFTMVDSWYMTPPPCFVSTGPVYMEMSPFENLLIEHPSMSIYHSITAAKKTSESFVNFDLEVSETSQTQGQTLFNNSQNFKQNRQEKENFNFQTSHEIVFVKPSATLLGQKIESDIGKSARTPRIDHCNATNKKMDIFAMNSQKSVAIYDRRNLRRNAILRANQVREIQGRSNRRRRTDMQHSRVISGANNNRKCC